MSPAGCLNLITLGVNDCTVADLDLETRTYSLENNVVLSNALTPVTQYAAMRHSIYIM